MHLTMSQAIVAGERWQYLLRLLWSLRFLTLRRRLQFSFAGVCPRLADKRTRWFFLSFTQNMVLQDGTLH